MRRRFLLFSLPALWLAAASTFAQDTKVIIVGGKPVNSIDRAFGCVSGDSPGVNNADRISDGIADSTKIDPIYIPGKKWVTTEPIVVTNTSRVLSGNGIARPGSGNSWGINRGPTSRIVNVFDSDGVVTFGVDGITASAASGSQTITVSGFTCRASDALQTLVIEGGTNFAAGTYNILFRNGQTWTLDRDCTNGGGAASGMTGYFKPTMIRDDAYGSVYSGLDLQGSPNYVGGTPDTNARAAVLWHQPPSSESFASGSARAGGSSTELLLATATSLGNDALNGRIAYLSGGTGAGQYALVTDYDGPTDTATVTPAWTTTPDATTTYKVLTRAVDSTPNTGKSLVENCTFENADVGILLGKGLAKYYGPTFLSGTPASSFDGWLDSNADHLRIEKCVFQACSTALAVRCTQSVSITVDDIHTQKCDTIFYVERGGKLHASGVFTTDNGGLTGPVLLRTGGAGSDGSTVSWPIVIDGGTFDAPSTSCKLLVQDSTGNQSMNIAIRNFKINPPSGSTHYAIEKPVVSVTDGTFLTLEGVELFPEWVRLANDSANNKPRVLIQGCVLNGASGTDSSILAHPEYVLDLLTTSGHSQAGTEVCFIGNTGGGYDQSGTYNLHHFCRSGVYRVDYTGGPGGTGWVTTETGFSWQPVRSPRDEFYAAVGIMPNRVGVAREPEAELVCQLIATGQTVRALPAPRRESSIDIVASLR